MPGDKSTFDIVIAYIYLTFRVHFSINLVFKRFNFLFEFRTISFLLDMFRQSVPETESSVVRTLLDFC